MGRIVTYIRSADTKLADRTAALEARDVGPIPITPASPAPSTSKAVERASTPTRSKTVPPNEPEASPTDTLARLRSDLATTQKARATLQSQLTDLTASLTTLQTQQKSSTVQIALLTRQKADTERRLRDRDDELRGQKKLAEDAQDEMVALGLQLNLSEAKAENLRTENEELVRRWVERMGEEVERVNRDSRWE
jgi:hypothetical protein